MNRILLAAAFAIAAPAIAEDRTYVDVGSPNFQPLPIAVAEFQSEGEARAAKDAAEVVRGGRGWEGADPPSTVLGGCR